MARRRRASRNSLPQRNSQIVGQLTRISDREAVPQVTSIPFDHQHAEDFVVDVPLDQCRRSRQHFVQIQRSIHFLADFRKCRKHFRGHLRAAVQRGCRRRCVC